MKDHYYLLVVVDMQVQGSQMIIYHKQITAKCIDISF